MVTAVAPAGTTKVPSAVNSVGAADATGLSIVIHPTVTAAINNGAGSPGKVLVDGHSGAAVERRVGCPPRPVTPGTLLLTSQRPTFWSSARSRVDVNDAPTATSRCRSCR